MKHSNASSADHVESSISIVAPRALMRKIVVTHHAHCFSGIVCSKSAGGAGRLHMFIWIDSGHEFKFDQPPDLWLLQDRMGTSVRRVIGLAFCLLGQCPA